MIEQVLNRMNMIRAYRQVLSNKGSAGVDGMTVKELYSHLSKNRELIETSIRQSKYQPQAILGVAIPKSNGKTRLLGIPTVTDRLLQQAVGQVIAIKFEVEFEDYSYGFRPNRNAQQAVIKAQDYINAGYQHIVDIDLKSFFDEVVPLYPAAITLPQDKMPTNVTPNPQMAESAYPYRWQTHQAQKRRTAGKSAEPFAVQHHAQ